MALTIAIEGKGVIANCDALTDDTGGTTTGDWTEQGGGTMTLTPDVFLFGTNSIAGKYANKDGFQQFDLGTGNELDFTAGTGSEAGQFLYIWINMAAFAVLDDISTGGLFIRVSSDSPGDTSNYLDYCIAGGNGSSNGVSANGWTGGWKLFVIDPLKAPTRSNGTQSAIVASVVTLGVYLEVWDSVRAESIFIDQVAVGSGLRITGTSTTGWKDVMEYCTDYANRAWGMVQERDGVYYLFGKMYIGDATQAADTSFADSGRVLQFGTSQYYSSGGTWVTSMPADACGIVVEDHATYKTTFTDGVIVGSDNGRSGSTIIGNADQSISLDLYGGNHADSVTAFYGTILKDIRGTINSGNDAGHKFLGMSMSKCEQFDPVGAPVLRNCTFAETVNTDAAVVWNSSIDIQDCNFIANTLGAGMEHPAQGTFNYTALVFSGNTYDILYSAAASSGKLTINKDSDSEVSTYEIENPTGNSVSIDLSVTITVNVQNSAGDDIENARVLLEADTGGDLPVNESVNITSTGGTATVTHTDHGLSTDNYVIIRGANQPEYNNDHQIIVTGTHEYTYVISGSPVSPATGTITATSRIINELTTAGGVATESFNYGTDQPITGIVRKSSGIPFYKTGTVSGTIKSTGFTANLILILDQ